MTTLRLFPTMSLVPVRPTLNTTDLFDPVRLVVVAVIVACQTGGDQDEETGR